MINPAPSTSEPFRLVSWNIFQGMHHRSKRERWVVNDTIEQHLADLDADVLVLAEAWKFQQPDATWAEHLAAQLGYELHQWIGPAPSRTQENVPWRIVILTRISAEQLDPHVFPQFGSFGVRAATQVRLTDSALTIAGTHLYGIHLVTQGRLRQWWRERAVLRELTAMNDIVAGDMNIWGPVVRRDAGELRLAVKGRTFPANRPHSQIDHILVSPRVEVIDSQVLPDLGSDHRAIAATLQRRG